jgi:hypothetical protein
LSGPGRARGPLTLAASDAEGRGIEEATNNRNAILCTGRFTN